MVQEEEENYAEGKIPSFFLEKGVFTNHEVYDLLKTHVSSKQDSEHQWTPHPMLQKTLEYTQRFSSVKSTDAAEQMRNLLISNGLGELELTAIINMLPETAEEARALMPSLKAKDELTDERLQQCLNELQQYRRYD